MSGNKLRSLAHTAPPLLYRVPGPVAGGWDPNPRALHTLPPELPSKPDIVVMIGLIYAHEFSSFLVIIDVCVCHYLKESRTFCLNRNSTTVNFSTCCSSGVDLKLINRAERKCPSPEES